MKETCDTCLFSTFQCRNTHMCERRDHCVVDDYSCDEWEPFVFCPTPDSMPVVFGSMDDSPQ